MLLLATSAVHESERHALPALGGHLYETQARLAKNNDTLPIPGDAPDIDGGAEFLYRHCRDLNSFEIGGSLTGKVAAIRGPEDAIVTTRLLESTVTRYTT